MNICQKAHKTASGRIPTQVLPVYDNTCKYRDGTRSYHSSSIAALRTGGTEPPPKTKPGSAKKRQRAERDQLIKSLKESPGKRDARNFLKHFDAPKKTEPALQPKVERAVSDVVGQAHYNAWRLNKTGVNLGNLYAPTKAIEETPVFTRQTLPDQFIRENAEPLHIALVKLRQPQALDNETLGGIALTLSQMVRLGLNIALVVDCDENGEVEESVAESADWEVTAREQANRIVELLEGFNPAGAFLVQHALGYSEVQSDIPTTAPVRGSVEVKSGSLVLSPLEDGIIAVIPPIAWTDDMRKRRVQPDDVVLALTREFAGITSQSVEEIDLETMCDTLHEKAKVIGDKPLLDRIIILDPLGGLPSEDRHDKSHVFVNLEAEYKEVRNELAGQSFATPSFPSTKSQGKHSILGASNSFSKFAEDVVKPLTIPEPKEQLSTAPMSNRHTRNLDVVQRALKILPPSSSALVISPSAAATSSQPHLSTSDDPLTGVRTRRSKNPLIHNLLTDKPMVSSSLPTTSLNPPPTTTHPNHPTFLKKGIPVTVIPDAKATGGWIPPRPGAPTLELDRDPRIDFPRLVDLIEDSFQRKLDAQHYLTRIHGRVAGIIIAGNYEGGAICTWETPPGSPSSLQIPYLDKFAVLTSSQGSGGVADIVWGSLTRTCFPNGLLWRSRSNNPVNKWYFERSVGMWNLPGGQWTMFWTEGEVVEEWAKRNKETQKGELGRGEDMTRWEAYVDVCQGVKPSWADGKRPD